MARSEAPDPEAGRSQPAGNRLSWSANSKRIQTFPEGLPGGWRAGGGGIRGCPATVFPWLIQNVLFPLDALRSGDGAKLRYLREFEATQYLPPEELEALRLRRLRAVLDQAYRKCPWYTERFRAAGVTPADIRTLGDLSVLPPLAKTEVQEHGEAMVAKDWPRADLIPDATGGSTGTPVRFCYGKDRKLSRAAATLRHNRWAGWRPGDKVAYVWGAPQDLRVPRSLKARLRNVLIDRTLFLDAGHLTEARLDAFVTDLERFRPAVIQAYARALALFARHVEQRGGLRHRPRTIVTSAETLDPDDRARIERVLGAPVHDRYGSREFSVLASECERRDGFHVMAEGLILEIVRDGRPAAPGETGAVLVTDLMNFAMPLIRYRIGDVAAFAPGACACGRSLPRLQKLAGRVTDFLVGADGRLVSGVFLATYVVAQRPSLGQVQLVQETAGEVTYRIKPGSGFRAEADVAYLAAATREHLGEPCTVRHEIVDDLPAEPSGKFVFSRSRAADKVP